MYGIHNNALPFLAGGGEMGKLIRSLDWSANPARLFERFYRSNNEKLQMVSGFGVGLYLVSEFLRFHNSKIELKSKENAGSTFYFSLDIHQSENGAEVI